MGWTANHHACIPPALQVYYDTEYYCAGGIMDIKSVGNKSTMPFQQVATGGNERTDLDSPPQSAEDIVAASSQNAPPIDVRKAAGALLGNAPDAAPPLPAEVTWSFQAPSNCSAPPVTGPEGNVYVRASEKSIIALDTRGNMLWKAPLEDVFGEAPCIDERGNIYYTDSSFGAFKIISYDSKGKKRWEYEHEASTGSRIGGMDRMFMDRDNNSIAIPFKNMIYNIDRDTGKSNWTFSVSDYKYGDIGYLERGPEGDYYLACRDDGAIHVLDARTGKEKKRLKGPGESHCFHEISMAKEGTIYTIEDFADKSSGNKSIRGIRALSPDGADKWFTKGEFSGRPVIGTDGTIYLRRKEGKKDCSLNALDPETGKLKWFMPIKGENAQDPVITPEGNLLLNVEVPGKPLRKHSNQGKTWNRSFEENPVSKIICVRPDGLTKWTMDPGMWIYTPLSIDEKNGILYGADNGGQCLGIDLKRLDSAVEDMRQKGSTPENEPVKIEVEDDFINVGGIRLPISRA
jgi:outer membrane protein assembly factor BamB